MSALAFTQYELLRLLRDRRFVAFSLAFPLLLYVAVTAPNRNVHDLAHSGVPAPLYFMVGLAAFGTMNAVLGVGARIAAERGIGWNRQLRLTPLAPRAYLGAKVAAGYLIALATIAAVFLAGAVLGVSMSVSRWAETTAMLLICLVPFATLGILLGHLVTADSVGPVTGGASAILALLGGVWFPLDDGVLHAVAQALPAYWLVHARQVGAGAQSWSATGWIVTIAWTVLLIAAARWAYGRDTRRV